MKNVRFCPAASIGRGQGVWKWLGTAMLCVMLYACGGDLSNDPSPEGVDPVADADVSVPGPVKGRITLDAPVAGAAVSLQTRDGQTLAGTAVTDAEGRFEIPATEVQRGLRIVAVGGTLPDGAAVSATLSTYVEPFSADGFEEEITAVSTLFDRLRIAGNLDAETAFLKLSGYLQLRPGRSPYSTYMATHDFNSSIFLQKVADSGAGFDGFVDELVNEALANPESQRIFTGGLQLSPLGTAVAMGLVNGAVSKVSGTAMGSILSGIGIGNGDHGAVMAQLALIEDKLDEVKGTVKDAVARIANVQTELKQQTMEGLINNVLTLMEDLQTIDRFTGQNRTDRQLEIENAILDLSSNRQLIARVLDGKLGREALIQSYADGLRVNQRFYSSRHYQRLVDFVEYFDSINIQLYYLLIEAYRSREARTGASSQTMVEILAEELNKGRDSYLKRIPWELPDTTAFINIAESRMWYGSRSYYVLYNEPPTLPTAVAAKGGWRIPDEATARGTFSQTDRTKIDGNTFALKEGAPGELFNGGGIKIWTTTCRTTFVEVNCQVYNFADDDTMRVTVEYMTQPVIRTNNGANYMVWRPMERAELARYLPWLYPELEK